MTSLKKQLFFISFAVAIIIFGLLLLTYRIALIHRDSMVLTIAVSRVQSSASFLIDGLSRSEKSDSARYVAYIRAYQDLRENLNRIKLSHLPTRNRVTLIEQYSFGVYQYLIKDSEDLGMGVGEEGLSKEGTVQAISIDSISNGVTREVAVLSNEIESYQTIQIQRLYTALYMTGISVALLFLLLGYFYSRSIGKFLAQFSLVLSRITQGRFAPLYRSDLYDEIEMLCGAFQSLSRLEDEKMEFIRSQLHELEKFKLVVQNLDDGVAIMDKDGFVIFINEGLKNMTGYSAAEMIGQRPRHWTDPESTMEIWSVAKKKKQVITKIAINTAKDGMSFTSDIKVFPILGHNKEVRMLVSLERALRDAVASKKSARSAPQSREIGAKPAALGKKRKMRA